MSINVLIQQIAPLYNKYRENKDNISGTDAIEIMWDIGDYLKDFILKNKVAPHFLYREIYGKSEGQKNTSQKSYITREFLGKCYRIRNIFNNKKEIREHLPNLKRFRLFSQSMPFFDNVKYKLKGKEKESLLILLNSNASYKEIINQIYKLQKEKIGIKNPRTQRLHEVEREKQIFIDFYNFIYNIIRLDNYKLCLNEISNVDLEYIKTLSKNISALSQEGLKIFSFDIPNSIQTPWKEFSEVVKNLIIQKDPKLRRRFRRLIPVERIIRLADMLYGLLSEENYKNIKKRI